jgi:tetratricopeptide (TPR) repeat protein
MPHASRRKLSGKSAAWDWKLILQAGGIVTAVFCVFWPALNGGWIGDDYLYITTNSLLYDPARLWKAWFQPGSFIEYYPIEQSVQFFQWQLWRNDTFGYHLTNIVLHATSALLVWRLLSKFGLRLAWLGGLIFAVHPMAVDSVALVNELKSALSLPPFLLAMCFYMDYEERGRSRDYGLALGFFVAAMLCKITMALFPVVILLYAWWKRNRVGWGDLAASVPFFAISVTLCLTTIWSGAWYMELQGNAPAVTSHGSLLFRLALAGQIISFYFSRCFLPLAPMPIYPRWTVDPSLPWQFLPWPILGGTIFYLWTKRETWGRHALLGLGFFLIMLAPFLGLNWVSYMNDTWVLEHLLYIPMIGLIALAVAGLEQIDDQLPQSYHRYGIGFVAGLIALLAFQSRAYAEKFVDEETLSSYTIAYNPRSAMAHANLGHALVQKGRVDQAMTEFKTALEINPDSDDANYCLGVAYAQKGDLDEAIAHYQKALTTNPRIAEAELNLGNALLQKGDVEGAITHYQKSLKINPSYPDAHNSLGNAFLQKNQVDGAMAEFQKALGLNPSYAEAHNNLGIAFARSGQLDKAITEFQEAVRLNPYYDKAQSNLERAQAMSRQNAPPSN